MDQAQHYPDKAAKYVLGIHRGPLPPESTDGNNLVTIDHIETADTITSEKVQRTPTEKFRRHWKRFWCCYAFWTLISLAIFLPVLYDLA